MEYTKINLFGHSHKGSKGTFDDIFANKYKSKEDAYAANDYVQADFVRDENGVLYIQAFHVKNPEIKKLHKLNYQRPVAGLDVMDDSLGVDMAASLL